MIVYATPEDLESWTGQPVDDEVKATACLRHASLLVHRSCRNDIYDTTPTGEPSDDDLSEAMRDATCAQAEVWIALDINPVGGIAAQAAPVTSASVDGGSVSYDTGTSLKARMRATEALCPAAFIILRDAGLGSSDVQ